MARGEAGFINAEMAVTVGGTVTGEGISGYTGGVTYPFFAKMRENDYQQARNDTTDGSEFNRRTGVPGLTSRKVNMTIYYKGTNYPPDFEQFPEALFQMVFGGGLTRTSLIILESFKQTGDVEKALEYTVTGESDGAFT
jgi:hypothetical protein